MHWHSVYFLKDWSVCTVSLKCNKDYSHWVYILWLIYLRVQCTVPLNLSSEIDLLHWQCEKVVSFFSFSQKIKSTVTLIYKVIIPHLHRCIERVNTQFLYDNHRADSANMIELSEERYHHSFYTSLLSLSRFSY